VSLVAEVGGQVVVKAFPTASMSVAGSLGADQMVSDRLMLQIRLFLRPAGAGGSRVCDGLWHGSGHLSGAVVRNSGATVSANTPVQSDGQGRC
jgi:hypothetical protein